MMGSFSSSMRACWLLSVTMIPVAWSTNPNDSNGSVVTTFIKHYMDREEYEYCLEALRIADVNVDNNVSDQEYVTFSRNMGPPNSEIMSSFNSFEDLPSILQSIFYEIVCPCESHLGATTSTGNPTNASSCCIPGSIFITMPNTTNVDDLTSEERLYLYDVCLYTKAAAENVTFYENTAIPTYSPLPLPTSRPILNEQPTQQEIPTPSPSNKTAPTSPSVTPTPSPTVAPSLFPNLSSPIVTILNPDTIARVDYMFAIPKSLVGDTSDTATNTGDNNYNVLASILNELRKAMDRLAPQIAILDSEVLNFESNRHRRLQDVKILLPTSFGRVDEVECPSSLSLSSSLTCRSVRASIYLDIVNPNVTENDTRQLKQEYEVRLTSAIKEGKLKEELLLVNPNTPLTIFVQDNSVLPPNSTMTQIPGSAATDDADRSNTSGLSNGAISGIAVAASLIFIPIAFYYLHSKRRTQSRGGNDKIKNNIPGIMCNVEGGTSSLPCMDTSLQDTSIHDFSLDDDLEQALQSYESRAVPSLLVLTSCQDHEDDDEDQPTAIFKCNSDDSLLEDSPTSIDDPVSSPYIADFDSMGEDARASTTVDQVRCSQLDGMGSKATQSNNDSDPDVVKLSTLADANDIHSPQEYIDSHIEADEWGAVGATAVLLGEGSESTFENSSPMVSRGERTRGFEGTSDHSMDAQRAAELDRLVDKSDWDGLVAAVSRFETSNVTSDLEETCNRSSESYPQIDCSASSGSMASESDTAAANSIGTTSYETSVSESQGRSQTLNEIRAEVEALVRRVAPEEIMNVDEMMEQFKGREEVLLETLRNMQERLVAQKARIAKQRAAKVQARKSIRRADVSVSKAMLSRVEDSEFEHINERSPTDDDSVASSTNASLKSRVEGSTEASSMPDNENFVHSMKQHRANLELAIDTGDWSAAATAAAMLSNASQASDMSNNNIDSDSTNVSGLSEESSLRTRSLGDLDAERASELDGMVQIGDWMGIINAARRYNEDDGLALERTRGPSQEEEEALKQAELWSDFAEKTKPTATNKGASSAAEWAIHRSFSKMNESEKD